MQGRRHSTIVNYVEYLMTQQIEQDHFACGEHSNFYVSIQHKKQYVAYQVVGILKNKNTRSARYKTMQSMLMNYSG